MHWVYYRNNRRLFTDGANGWVVKLTTYLHPVPRYKRVSGALFLFPLHADMACTGSALPFLPVRSCAKVKNEWVCTSTPFVCVQGMDREESVLFFTSLWKASFQWCQHKNTPYPKPAAFHIHIAYFFIIFLSKSLNIKMSVVICFMQNILSISCLPCMLYVFCLVSITTLVTVGRKIQCMGTKS